ncbi:hypothetical protein, partial [Parvibacter caecicola]
PHAPWATAIYQRRRAALRRSIPSGSPSDGPSPLAPWMQDAVTAAFAQVLACTGVFKDDEIGRAGWAAFLEKVNA